MTRGTSSPKATNSSKAISSRLLGLSALLALSLLIAGCGDEEDTTVTAPPTAAETTAPEAPGTTEPAPEREAEDIPVGDGDGGVELTEIGSFSDPVYVAQPPGEDEDLYVVEQGGTIQRLAPGGGTETFLDVSDEIVSGGEQGLLSVAFAPDYEQSGKLYVDYTDTEGDTRIVEYAADDGIVDESTRRELLRVDQPYANHNGGLVLFGPDGKLYIGLGDGGGADDQDRRALDLSQLLGKILRIDPAPDGDLPYTVPTDNPFAGDGDERGEIYSYGLRNPWRFSFDRDTGDLTIGDVGQEEEEEVDIVAKGEGSGANFGWSAFEGKSEFNSDQSAPNAIPPVYVATHSDGNCSITGGVVSRDPDLPSIYGRYVWGDFCAGEIQSFPSVPNEEATDNRSLGLRVESLSSFGEDNEGNVYAVSLSGPVYRLDPNR